MINYPPLVVCVGSLFVDISGVHARNTNCMRERTGMGNVQQPKNKPPKQHKRARNIFFLSTSVCMSFARGLAWAFLTQINRLKPNSAPSHTTGAPEQQYSTVQRKVCITGADLQNSFEHLGSHARGGYSLQGWERNRKPRSRSLAHRKNNHGGLERI